MAVSACVSAVLLLAVVSDSVQVTPVQKVLQMMNEIKQKGIEEKEAEEVTFTKFSTWCVNTDKHKKEAVARATQAIATLTAGIAKNEMDAKNLGKQIMELDAQVDTAAQQKADATKVREAEKADYEKAHAEHLESTEQLEVGVEKLKTMMASGPGAAASFIQEFVSKPAMNEHARRVLTAFLAASTSDEITAANLNMQRGDPALGANPLDVAAPEAHSFDSQSGGVVGMMNELHDKLEDETSTLTSEEMDAKHTYQMMAQTLTDSMEKMTATRNRRASTKKEKEAEAAEWKGELADAEAQKAADEKYLEDLKSTCLAKTEAFEARQKLRAEELEALDKAIDIIADSSVSGASEKHLPQFAQLRHKALAQLRSTVQAPEQIAAASFLKMQARKLNSQALSALSLRITSDPFKKVVKMVKDMIMKLTQEATDEAEHKGFCDTELATNKQTRDTKSADVDELTANIEEMTATSNKLAAESSQLAADVASVDDAVAEATSVRQEEKAKNAATLADAEGAIFAVSKATDVLKEFYAKAAGATSLTQVRKGVDDDMPETFDKPFTGMGGEGGILGMLEVILSDFQRLEAETTEIETQSAAEFETFSNDSAMDKAVKSQEIKNKDSLRQKTDSNAQQAKSDLQATQEELDAAFAYYEKLKPSCVDAGLSYEDRVRQREEEMQSLKEALTILQP